MRDIAMPYRNGSAKSSNALKRFEMNAFDVLVKMREMGIKLPVIVISAFFSEETIEESLPKGAFKCINKPFHMGDMLNVVKEATATFAIP